LKEVLAKARLRSEKANQEEDHSHDFEVDSLSYQGSDDAFD